MKVLEMLASSNDKITLDKSDEKISIDHIIAIRDKMGKTTNKVSK